jgi:excisionase family DNA binding protein
MTTTKEPAFMTVEEVADLLRVPPASIYRWRYESRRPVAYRIGRFLRFDRADVLAWIEGQRDS